MNFLTYNKPSNAEASWLLGEDIRPFLNKARTTLFRKSRGKQTYYKTPKDLSHAPKQMERINSIIKYDLELIGQYSNQRFGSSSHEQHQFFQRPGEQETFFLHLFRSVQEHKRTIVTALNDAAEKEFMASMVAKSHETLRMWENKDATLFKVAKELLSEKQLYAAGVFYMINFLLAAKEEPELTRYNKLMERLDKFSEGTSYSKVDSKKGGKQSGVSRRGNKEKAYDLFCKEKIYENSRDKNGAAPKIDIMLSEMNILLRKERITVSEATLKTHWIPEFAERWRSLTH